jgi:hypothetical protein
LQSESFALSPCHSEGQNVLLLKPKLIIAGLVSSLLLIVYAAHWIDKRNAVNRAVAEAREEMVAAYTKKLLEASEAAREREAYMIASADKMRKDKDARIAALSTHRDSLIVSLQQRPQRTPSPSQAAQCPCDGQAASGADLSRQDAEFLVREAARADGLREALDACYKQYDAVRDALKK